MERATLKPFVSLLGQGKFEILSLIEGLEKSVRKKSGMKEH
jgi:hypothetical protein